MIPSPETLTRANAIIQQIETLQAELLSIFGGKTRPTGKRRGRLPGSGKASTATTGATVRRRRMSAEGRARIAAAAKARWARFHVGKKRDAAAK